MVSFDAIDRAASKRVLVLSDKLLRAQSGSGLLACGSRFLAPLSESRPNAGRKRSRRPVSQSLGAECSGCVFGVELNDLLFYTMVDGVCVAALARSLHAVLVPVAEAALATRGPDAEGLCIGLAARHTCRPQVASQSPCSMRLHPKHGSPHTVLSLTSAIYALFSMLTNASWYANREAFVADVAWLVERRVLLAVLVEAESRSDGFLPRGFRFGGPNIEDEAFEIEMRALQRAKAGVRAAMYICDRQRLNAMDAIRLQLSYFRVAAWPRDVYLDADGHSRMLERLTNALFYAARVREQRSSGDAFARPSAGIVVPLAELCCAARDDRDAFSDASSVDTGSSFAALSATSSQAGDDAMVVDAQRAHTFKI